MVSQRQAPVGCLDYVIVCGRIYLQDPVVVIFSRDGPPQNPQARRIWPIVANRLAAIAGGFATGAAIQDAYSDPGARVIPCVPGYCVRIWNVAWKAQLLPRADAKVCMRARGLTY